MHLRNWRAKRAGSRITITGIGAGGGEHKIVGVEKIEAGPPGSDYVVAYTALGTHRLLAQS
jgi:hypothetical protein